jgi:hypothetical protein
MSEAILLLPPIYLHGVDKETDFIFTFYQFWDYSITEFSVCVPSSTLFQLDMYSNNIIDIQQMQSDSLNSAKCLPQWLSASHSFVKSVTSFTGVFFFFAALSGKMETVATFFSSVMLIEHEL